MGQQAASAPVDRARPPSKAFGLLYGVGFGGFVDGIALHQILQWHHMLSDVDRYPTSTIAGLETNTLVDGLFHAATWAFLLAASLLAVSSWQQGRLAPNWRFHFGLLLMGWGLFNLLEGLVNHQILGVHHLRDDLSAPVSWDMGFLVLAGLLIVGGWLLHRAGARPLDHVARPHDAVMDAHRQ